MVSYFHILSEPHSNRVSSDSWKDQILLILSRVGNACSCLLNAKGFASNRNEMRSFFHLLE